MEQKKLLWIALAVGVFLMILIGAAILIISGGGQSRLVSVTPSPSPSRAPSLIDPASSWLYGDVPGYSPRPSATSLPSAMPTIDPLASPLPDQDTTLLMSPSPSPAAIPRSYSGPIATPVAKSTPKPSPASPPKTAPKPTANPTRYWVQVASFKSLPKAEELKASLVSSGMTATIIAATVSGESVYRVRIGPYGNKEEAERWMLIVRKIEGLESSYVTEVSAR